MVKKSPTPQAQDYRQAAVSTHCTYNVNSVKQVTSKISFLIEKSRAETRNCHTRRVGTFTSNQQGREV